MGRRARTGQHTRSISRRWASFVSYANGQDCPRTDDERTSEKPFLAVARMDWLAARSSGCTLPGRVSFCAAHFVASTGIGLRIANPLGSLAVPSADASAASTERRNGPRGLMIMDQLSDFFGACSEAGGAVASSSFRLNFTTF